MISIFDYIKITTGSWGNTKYAMKQEEREVMSWENIYNSCDRKRANFFHFQKAHVNKTREMTNNPTGKKMDKAYK
jgi:hypothetical protein